jgi:hypothetical protein
MPQVILSSKHKKVQGIQGCYHIISAKLHNDTEKAHVTKATIAGVLGCYLFLKSGGNSPVSPNDSKVQNYNRPDFRSLAGLDGSFRPSLAKRHPRFLVKIPTQALGPTTLIVNIVILPEKVTHCPPWQ